MKIAFNPSTVTALITPPNNKDITFDLRGRNIFARGVKFCGTDTNTWRDIKINNVSIGSNILDLRNGSNTTLTNTNGVVTINSTQRPVVDNLTSDSTTSSLSANQGRVLAGLINGKSDSGHNHDDRYVKKSGDTMSDVLTIDTTNFGALTIKRNDDANGASIQFRGKSSVYGYIGLNNSTKDKQFLRWGSDTSKTYTILDTSSTYTSNGKGIINGTTITQVDNATSSGNADKVDGYHASSLLTSVTNTNNGISVTVGGTTKSVSNISVNYANSAGSVAWANVTGKPTMPSNIMATTAQIVTISGSTVTVNASLDAYKTPGEFNIFGTSNGDYAKMYVQSGIGDAFNGTRVITQTIKITISHNTYAEICDVTRQYKSNTWSKWTVMYLGND